MSIFLEIMKEELERNLLRQRVFKGELDSLPKGYLSICNIDGKSYVYRKYRSGNKIISEYIGVPGDENVLKAEQERNEYLSNKEALKRLKKEELRLRKAIDIYKAI